MRLPRTIRLDPSDLSVFDHAAEPGEWAVPGSFAFLDARPDSLTGKRRAAFAAGFLGLDSFGWSTLVMVTDAPPEAVAAAEAALAGYFVDALGAPSIAAASRVARQEIAFAAGLCDHPVGTLLAVSRHFEHDELTERFKTIVPQDPDRLGHGAPFDLLALAARGSDDE